VGFVVCSFKEDLELAMPVMAVSLGSVAVGSVSIKDKACLARSANVGNAQSDC
jgi:hypothetical protein